MAKTNSSVFYSFIQSTRNIIHEVSETAKDIVDTFIHYYDSFLNLFSSKTHTPVYTDTQMQNPSKFPSHKDDEDNISNDYAVTQANDYEDEEIEDGEGTIAIDKLLSTSKMDQLQAEMTLLTTKEMAALKKFAEEEYDADSGLEDDEEDEQEYVEEWEVDANPDNTEENSDLLLWDNETDAALSSPLPLSPGKYNSYDLSVLTGSCQHDSDFYLNDGYGMITATTC